MNSPDRTGAGEEAGHVLHNLMLFGEVLRRLGLDYGTGNMLDLVRATRYSVNTVFAQLILDVGPQRVVDVARRMGIPGPDWAAPTRAGCRPTGSRACSRSLRPLPALALGSPRPGEVGRAFRAPAVGVGYR